MRRRSARWSRDRLSTCIPLKRYAPAVGLSSAPMMFMAVDLPEPDAPMMATNSPSSIEKLTPRRASKAASPVP